MHCLGSFQYCKIFAFEGQNVENKNFPVKCYLPEFYIVALGPAVSLDLFKQYSVSVEELSADSCPAEI